MQFAMNAFQMLYQATGLYSQQPPGPLWDIVGAQDKVLVELEPEDEARYEEIHRLNCSIHRLAKTLHGQLDRVQAHQTLFWQDVRDKYEKVKLEDPPSIGIRKNEKGEAVIVAGPDPDPDGPPTEVG